MMNLSPIGNIGVLGVSGSWCFILGGKQPPTRIGHFDQLHNPTLLPVVTKSVRSPELPSRLSSPI